tara:strand:- start:677 stop:1261 length:585 start_codon:yes stop_codon:yes gene_type:complete
MTKPVIEDLFSVPLYSEQLNLNTNIITKYCLSMKKTLNTSTISNIGGWQSSPLTGEHKPLNTLLISILNAAKLYQDTFQYKHPLVINTLWININQEKDYNLEHNHPNSVMSGVYYVKAQKNSGDLVLSHPASIAMEYDWSGRNLKKYNKYNSPMWKIPPIENRLLLFPSWLLHSVRPNLNKNKNRISISFNLCI